MDNEEWMGWEVHKARFLDGLFVGIEENGNLHRFDMKAMRTVEKKERDKKRKDDRKAKYERLVAFYHNEDNIVNERSPFDD